MHVRVIGVGSPWGDDAAGWVVAQRLADGDLPPGVSVSLCARPLPDLLEALEGADAVILVDALRSGGQPGSVRRLAADDLERLGSLSSHGLGVGDVLALAQALDRAPRRVELVGVEAATAGESAPDAAVERSLERACRLVQELSLQLSAELESAGAPG